MNIDDMFLWSVLLGVAAYFAFRDRFVYRSPRLFRHGGVYLKLWGQAMPRVRHRGPSTETL